MPKFAANLTMMFNEVPFLDRFEAAAKAGFKYVEYLWPYEFPAQTLKAKLEQYGLKQVLFNTAAGDVSKGEWGLSHSGTRSGCPSGYRSGIGICFSAKLPERAYYGGGGA